VISLDDVERARATIAGRVHRTPTFSSHSLGVSLKAELFQKTGSFKVRGVLNRMAALTPEERERGVVTWSAGNHAQAVAWAAAHDGVDALVVMWQGANPLKIEATRGYGAAVDLEASGPAEAHERLLGIVEETGRVFVHPFDDPHMISGHGTLALEVIEDRPGVETVVVPVGGGGLISGVVLGLAGRARVVAVEPEGAATLARALEAGHSVPVQPKTIADGLAAPFAGELPIELCRGVVESVIVTDDEIAAAMRFLYTRAKLACEPAGATGAAAILSGKVPRGDGVVVVVSGGNAAPLQTAAILAER
jgi:threonine dehydratase